MKKSVCSIERPNQRGFTLLEMMITVTVFAIMVLIALVSYSDMQRKNRVWSAAEELGTLMQASRLRALSTGSTQYVTVDIEHDRIAGTFWGGTYSSGHVSGGWRSTDGTDWVDSLADGSAPGSPITTLKTFSFTSRGSGSNASIKVQSNGIAAGEIVITVNGTTGRVKYTEL